MEFKIEPSAKIDIQEEIHYYNSKQKGLGKKFHSEIKKCFDSIRKSPAYQIRYSNIRCLPVKKFPSMIHYTFIDDKIVIRAVINTYRNPEKEWL